MLLWKWLLFKIRAWGTIAQGSTKPIIENRTEEDKFFSFAPFHGFKNDFALRQLFDLKKQLKKKERKKYNEDTPLDVEFGRKDGFT